MKIENTLNLISINKGDGCFKFLETGDVFEFLYNDIIINSFQGTDLYGSMNNIYLRIHENGKKSVYPLLGINSQSLVSYNDSSIIYKGEKNQVNYEVRFTLTSMGIWFWEVFLDSKKRIEVDLIYGQDISISNKNACLSNELYMSQYIHHEILEDSNGVYVSSRQNQAQNGRFPYISQGSIDTNIISFSTDQTQFFKEIYKDTNIPYSLYEDNLSNENYQYELSYIALQTEKISLEGSKKITFYGIFRENIDKSIDEICFKQEICREYEKLHINHKFVQLNKIEIKDEFSEPISSLEFSKDEIDCLYKDRILEEFDDDNGLLSFFLEDSTHVVLKKKELKCRRPHGHIIMSPIKENEINTDIIASTNYMFGCFGAQLVIGNTSLNKFTSVNRGLLNVLKNTGQRIYVKLNGKFRMLTLSGIYELYANYARWFYKLDNDILVVESYVAYESKDIILNIYSQNNKEYEYIVTNQIVMGSNEFENSYNVDVSENIITVTAGENTFIESVYKDINYRIKVVDCKFSLGNDAIFFKDNISRNKSLMTIKTDQTKGLKIVIRGSLTKKHDSIDGNYNIFEEKEKFKKYYDYMTCGFSLNINNKIKYELEKINKIFFWYTHNALIHYASPHGLEQSGGAAFGTRDVCQGPFEYFMATGKFDVLRIIIVEVFKHQFKETGEWPQWFMFDKYNMQQDDSHGDIVFWPLKIVGDYLEITGDYSILNEVCEYRSYPNCKVVEGEKIIDHIKRGISSIKNRFLYDTYLVSYAGGDWDDTLQPANKEFKEKLVSTWTVSLSYEVLLKLSKVLDDEDLKSELDYICKNIKKDFENYCIKDGVIAGFLYFNDEDKIEYMLHPLDKNTNIKYRLLPMTRSIISEIISLEQCNLNNCIIDENLTFLDGVRLMDSPPPYNKGIIKYFQRAEQAANVGREISLQYVHAHIRYIESLCKINAGEKAINALFTINPINIKEHVKNASYRQSNSYFSSSDGEFKDRYDFRDNFNKLKSGDVPVLGGWRIYSSGPGIYIKNIILNILGIKILKDKIIVNPNLCEELNGLEFSYWLFSKDVRIKYIIEKDKIENKISINDNVISYNYEKNEYRSDVLSIDINDFKRSLTNPINIIKIIF